MSDSFVSILAWMEEEVVKDGRVFPKIELLTPDEGRLTFQWIVKATGLVGEPQGWDMQHAVYGSVEPLTSSAWIAVGALPEDLAEQLLDEAGITSEIVIMMLPMQGGFDEGGRIARQDLIDFFDDLWYPMRDDIAVIDEEHERLFLLDHHGYTGAMSLGPRPNRT